MKLLDWMRRSGVDDSSFALQVGGCTAHAVKKWKYGERMPPADKILRIEDVTNGDVTLRDFCAGAIDGEPLPASAKEAQT